MTPFPEKMPFRGSDPTPPPVFVCYVCFVVLKILFVPLRVPSWFLGFSVPLRGSVFFVCFVVLEILFVPLRVPSWFLGFSVPLRGSVFSRVFRGSIPLVLLAMTMMIIFPFA